MTRVGLIGAALSVIAFVMLTLSGFSPGAAHSEAPASQQSAQEVQRTPEEDGGWSEWSSVSGAPFHVPQKALSSVFSVCHTTGVDVDNRAYNLKLSPTAFGRHTEGDFSSLRRAMGGNMGQMVIQQLFGSIAVCEVYRTENGKIDFRSPGTVRKDGVVLSGLSEPATVNFNTPLPGRKDLYEHAGTIRVIHGVFFFGQQYVPWWFQKGNDSVIVELKNAVLVTTEAALYGNDTTVIRSRDAALRIGDVEFQGEAQLSGTGVSLLPGTRFRTKGAGGE